MKEILKRLCAPVCVSGDEMTLSKMVYNEVSPYCDSAKIDKAGNVICTKKGKTTPKSKIIQTMNSKFGRKKCSIKVFY